MPSPATDLYHRFAELIDRPDRNIDLVEGALLIARAHESNVDEPACRQELTRLAQGARFRVTTSQPVADIARSLCRYLADIQDFRGNESDYYAPENSFLDQVLATRRGIPISLALVYLTVGRALGLDIRGVGFPGHFLVRLHRHGVAILDPFGGKVLDERECALLPGRVELSTAHHPFFLPATANRDILARMLANLKAIYSQRGAFADALNCTDWRLMIAPESPRDRLDRGALLEELNRIDEAVAAYEAFLEQAPATEIRRSVEEKIQRLRQGRKTLLH